MEQFIQNLLVADSLHIRGFDSIPQKDLDLMDFSPMDDPGYLPMSDFLSDDFLDSLEGGCDD